MRLSRKIAVTFLGIYLLLTTLIAIWAALRLPFQRGPAEALPIAGLAFALAHAWNCLGWRRALLFLVTATGISLLLESVGVATGLIYGPYHYTERFGPLFLGLVPYLIPLTWFLMLYPSYIIALRLAPGTGVRKALWIAGIGALAMTAWDLVLDPLMAQRGHWVWDVQGAYFGVPWQNYLGWWVTGFLILLVYQGIERRFRLDEGAAGGFGLACPPQWARYAVLVYAATGVAHVAEAWMAGLTGPALIGFLAMLPWAWLGWKENGESN